MILTPFISWYSFIEELNIDNMIKIKHESRVFYFFKLIIYLFYLTRKTRVGQCQWSKRLLAKHDSNYKERERERERECNKPTKTLQIEWSSLIICFCQCQGYNET